jgi:hypothetical protein
VWNTEKEICKEKTLSNVSYPVARQRVTARQQTTSTNISYAAAVIAKPTTATIGTQTDVTNCKCIPQETVQISEKSKSSETQTDQQVNQMQPLKRTVGRAGFRLVGALRQTFWWGPFADLSGRGSGFEHHF